MKQTYVAVKTKAPGKGKFVFKADFEPKVGTKVGMRTVAPVEVVSVLSEEEAQDFLKRSNKSDSEIPVVIFKKDQRM